MGSNIKTVKDRLDTQTACRIVTGNARRAITCRGNTKTMADSKMGLREIGCEDGRWIELAQDRVQWWAFVLAVLNLCVLLPES
jgi:hypothetical protein